MSLNAPRLDAADLEDRYDPRPLLKVETVYRGMVWDVQRDTIDLGEAGTVRREYLQHPGAVVVVPYRDSTRGPEILMISQYRHPVGVFEWELPAGLLDVEGEPGHVTAARELAEEADLVADTWHVLADYYASPGGMNEALRIYLARGLADVPEAERHDREAEELGMPAYWVDLHDAQTAALSGRVNNAGAVIGILATCAARDRGWDTLRPADVPWPQHPRNRPPR